MIRPVTKWIVGLSALLLVGCQSMQPIAGGTAMDGSWVSSDGVFVATFQDGSFTSVDAKTNAVLARGRYSVQGSTVALNWTSARRGQQFSATCTFTTGNDLHCSQPGSTEFDLRRTA